MGEAFVAIGHLWVYGDSVAMRCLYGSVIPSWVLVVFIDCVIILVCDV